HLFVFEGDGVVKDFNGNYAEYRESQKTEQSSEVKNKKIDKKESSKKTKLSYKEKTEFDKLEKEIADLEIEKSQLTELLNSGSSDYVELQKHALRLAEVTQALDEKSTRWLELSEIA
ncbi:ABC transporter ATP-binding protein, partial [bacterium]|nr:ABC transporter ATP-binding protein [bacterium]